MALIQYWLAGSVFLVTIFLLSDQDNFRFILLPSLLVGAVIDKAMRPHRPEEVPTPLEHIESSRAWKSFFILYAIFVVLIAALSITHKDVGSWFSHNPWILVPSILLPIIGPVVQDQVKLYKAFGEK